jgi:hypothetical protein
MKLSTRTLFTLLLVLCIGMQAATASAKGKKPFVNISGEWHYMGQPPLKEWFIGDDYYYIFHDWGDFYGGLEGNVVDSGLVKFTGDGYFFANYIVHFSGALVDESDDSVVGEGTLELHFCINVAFTDLTTRGTWKIVGGTGDLAHARGGGTWWGPGTDNIEGTPDLFYEGRIFLVPKKK